MKNDNSKSRSDESYISITDRKGDGGGEGGVKGERERYFNKVMTNRDRAKARYNVKVRVCSRYTRDNRSANRVC